MTKEFNYQRYLASREWGLLRKQVRQRSGGYCERGHDTPVKATAVHHVTYERIGHEDLDDLQHLCEQCHEFLSGEGECDPIDVEAADTVMIRRNDPYVVALEALVEWFARDFDIPLSENLIQFLRGSAECLENVDPDAVAYEGHQILQHSMAWFHIQRERREKRLGALLVP